MDEALFIQRDFESDARVVSCKFFLPTLEPGGEYKCRWTIDWPDRKSKRYACGIDGVQAMLLAMRAVHTELVDSDEYKTGRLTSFGERDFDMPPPFDLS